MHAWTHQKSESEDERKGERRRDALHVCNGTHERTLAHTHTHMSNGRSTHANLYALHYLLTMCLLKYKGLMCMISPFF